MAVSMRLFHQIVALLASLILIVMLTLAITSTVNWLWFWATAIVCLGISYLLRRAPKPVPGKKR